MKADKRFIVNVYDDEGRTAQPVSMISLVDFDFEEVVKETRELDDDEYNYIDVDVIVNHLVINSLAKVEDVKSIDIPMYA